jgi:hypothetical protein
LDFLSKKCGVRIGGLPLRFTAVPCRRARRADFLFCFLEIKTRLFLGIVLESWLFYEVEAS